MAVEKLRSDILSGLGKSAEPSSKVEDMDKSVTNPDLVKFDKDLYETALKALTGLIGVEANEAAEGSDEDDSIHHLLKAIEHLKEWYEGEVEEGEVAGAPTDDMINLSADTYKMCEKCEKSADECKCDDGAAKSATTDLTVDDAVMGEIIEKAVQTAKKAVEDEIESFKSATAVAEAKTIELEAQLSDALSKAAIGGPVRTGIKTKSVNVDDLLVKAAEFRNKASVTQDRTLAEGYRELAEDLEKKARKGRK
jgi:hypothetical protein